MVHADTARGKRVGVVVIAENECRSIVRHLRSVSLPANLAAFDVNRASFLTYSERLMAFWQADATDGRDRT